MGRQITKVGLRMIDQKRVDKQLGGWRRRLGSGHSGKGYVYVVFISKRVWNLKEGVRTGQQWLEGRVDRREET